MPLEIVEKNDKVLGNPSPSARTLSFDNFAIVYGLKCFIKDYEDIIPLKDEITTQVYFSAEKNDLSMPFPRQGIHINIK